MPIFSPWKSCKSDGTINAGLLPAKNFQALYSIFIYPYFSSDAANDASALVAATGGISLPMLGINKQTSIQDFTFQIERAGKIVFEIKVKIKIDIVAFIASAGGGTGLAIYTWAIPDTTFNIGPITVKNSTGRWLSSGQFVVSTATGGDNTDPGTTSGTNPPIITEYSPITGPRGTLMTMKGTNLGDVQEIDFNDARAYFEILTGKVIKLSGAGGSCTARDNFEINATASGHSLGGSEVTGNAPPKIDSFSPSQGPVGTTVEIVGTNLSSTTQITINDTPCNFTIVSDTKIVIKMIEGQEEIRVTVPMVGDYLVTKPIPQPSTLGTFQTIPVPGGGGDFTDSYGTIMFDLWLPAFNFKLKPGDKVKIPFHAAGGPYLVKLANVQMRTLPGSSQVSALYDVPFGEIWLAHEGNQKLKCFRVRNYEGFEKGDPTEPDIIRVKDKTFDNVTIDTESPDRFFLHSINHYRFCVAQYGGDIRLYQSDNEGITWIRKETSNVTDQGELTHDMTVDNMDLLGSAGDQSTGSIYIIGKSRAANTVFNIDAGKIVRSTLRLADSGWILYRQEECKGDLPTGDFESDIIDMGDYFIWVVNKSTSVDIFISRNSGLNWSADGV